MKNIRLRTYKDLGHILIDEGLVTRERLEEGQQVQSTSGHSLSRVLVELGFIDEWELAKAVVRELGLPFIRLRDTDLLSEASHKIRPQLLHQYLFFVLDRFGSVDTVVVAEPPPLTVLSELAPVLGEKVFFMVSLVSDVTRALDKGAPDLVTETANHAEEKSAEEILRGFMED